jgi:hypothetical protein
LSRESLDLRGVGSKTIDRGGAQIGRYAAHLAEKIVSVLLLCPQRLRRSLVSVVVTSASAAVALVAPVIALGAYLALPGSLSSRCLLKTVTGSVGGCDQLCRSPGEVRRVSQDTLAPVIPSRGSLGRR